MVVMLCVWCLFRVSYITVTVRLIPDIRVIFWAYPLTWSISSVIFLYLFLKGKWVYGFEKEEDDERRIDERSARCGIAGGRYSAGERSGNFRVEETIERIARAYGVSSSDAFVLSSGIF